jgi:hypothetical protein
VCKKSAIYNGKIRFFRGAHGNLEINCGESKKLRPSRTPARDDAIERARSSLAMSSLPNQIKTVRKRLKYLIFGTFFLVS